MTKPNYRLVATEVGDLAKWDASVNEIHRAASALLPCRIENFPNDGITSQRAQLIYNCVLSLAKHKIEAGERNRLLEAFCRRVVPESEHEKLGGILRDGLGSGGDAESDAHRLFIERGFHSTVHEHCKRLFAQGNYFHAVFEGCKVYNKIVQARSKSPKDGEALMLEVWGCEKGVLKITACSSETDRNVQDGVKFLSAGLMRAMRNPTAHEPALDWPIEKQDCLDMLGFLSFLLRQFDKATYFKA